MTVVLIASICGLTYFAMRRAGGGSEPRSATQGPGCSNHKVVAPAAGHYACFFAIAFVVSVVTLFDLPSMRHFQEVLCLREFRGSWAVVAVEAAYLITFSSAIACAAGILRQHVAVKLALPCLLLLGVAYTNATSEITYFVYAAPVVVPMLLYVLCEAGVPRVPISSLTFSAVFLVIVSFFPRPASTFSPLYPLPKASPFSGLYADPATHRLITAIWQNVTPQIRGRPTLWLLGGGPVSAYGGLPVPNVVYLHTQSYNTRSERRLWEAWHRNPPSYVVLGDFDRAPGAVLFRQESIESWLSKEFEIAWQDPELGLRLWKKRK
jgi:hypothetical protein